LIKLIHNHDVRCVFTQWISLVNFRSNEAGYPSLKTYLIKSICDFIEFEQQDGSLLNSLFSTWDFLVTDIHIESTEGHNWGESIDLSLYAEAVQARETYSTHPLSQSQKAYLKEMALEARIIKQYKNIKRVR